MLRKYLLWTVGIMVVSAIVVGLKAQDKQKPAVQPPDAGNAFGDASPPTVTKKATPAEADNPFSASDTPAAKPAQKSPVVKIKQEAKETKRSPVVPLKCGEEAILAALEENTSLDYAEIPFTNIIDDLQEKHHIPIKLDVSALKQANIDPTTLVSINVREIPLRSALLLMLDDLQLEWTIHADVLWITSPNKAADEYFATKVYDVSDLITPSTDVPYVGSCLPTTQVPEPGQGMSSAGMGGNFVPQKYSDSRSGMTELTDAIQASVDPQLWRDNGGPGAISPLGGRICVHQTYKVQLEVKSFLADLRAKRRAAPTVIIDLQRLWLDSSQYAQLLGSKKPVADAHASLAVDAKTLDVLSQSVPGIRGRIACANAQFVHIASGDRRSAIVATIPVVGGPGGVGYSPVVQVTNAGVVAELRATIAPGETTATLDIRSTVTRWAKAQETVHIGAAWPAYRETEGGTTAQGKDASAVHSETSSNPGGSASCPVQLVNMPAQELATTLRVPLGKPVIVGGMTFAPAGGGGLNDAAEKTKQLYLIATTSIATDAKP